MGLCQEKGQDPAWTITLKDPQILPVSPTSCSNPLPMRMNSPHKYYLSWPIYDNSSMVCNGSVMFALLHRLSATFGSYTVFLDAYILLGNDHINSYSQYIISKKTHTHTTAVWLHGTTFSWKILNIRYRETFFISLLSNACQIKLQRWTRYTTGKDM